MKYRHVLLAAASEIWCMEPLKLHAMIEFLAMQAMGDKLTAEQIEAKIGNAKATAVAKQEGAVGILPVRGIIAPRTSLVENSSAPAPLSAERLGVAFDSLVADDRVKAIILDVDGPGGAAQGMDELAAKVLSARGTKPIIAQVTGNAASATYWAICCADEIVLSPSSMVGSIGAMVVHEDVSRALDEAGIVISQITSAPRKMEAAAHLALTDEARAELQSKVDAFGRMFEARVAEGRGIAAATVREEFGQGRMVMAKDAVKAGMADRIATMSETLARFGVTPSPSQQRGEARAYAPKREMAALALD